MVLFDRNCPNTKVSYIGMNNFASTYQAVNILISSGYRHIAMITLDSVQPQMLDRLKGYEQAIYEHKLMSLVKKVDYHTAKAHLIMDELERILQDFPQINAVFFATNYLAITGIELFNKLKIRMGEQLGIMVFDDNDLFRIHQPSVSAIAQPIQAMSQQLIITLLEHLTNADTYLPQTYILPAQLIIRDSSKKFIV